MLGMIKIGKNLDVFKILIIRPYFERFERLFRKLNTQNVLTK